MSDDRYSDDGQGDTRSIDGRAMYGGSYGILGPPTSIPRRIPLAMSSMRLFLSIVQKSDIRRSNASNEGARSPSPESDPEADHNGTSPVASRSPSLSDDNRESPPATSRSPSPPDNDSRSPSPPSSRTVDSSDRRDPAETTSRAFRSRLAARGLNEGQIGDEMETRFGERDRGFPGRRTRDDDW